jgi:hypothetical protein
MLWIDEARFDAEGGALALARYAVTAGHRYDLALVRVPSHLLIAAPAVWAPATGSPAQIQAFVSHFVVEGVDERDPEAWERLGIRVIEHHRNVPLRLVDGSSNPRVARIARALDSQPLWRAAREVSRLDQALPRTSKRLRAARL